MRTSPYAPFYDLFKLIVAILLLLLFLFLMWIQPGRSTQLIPSAVTSTPVPSTTATASVTPTPLSPTKTPVITNTPSPTSLPAETSTPTQLPEPTPTPTGTPAPETTPPPATETPASANACTAASRSQLQVGMKATILHRLNFRSSAGIHNNWLLTNSPGTQVDVIGGPACTTYQNGSSYLWWQIKLPNGSVGWSAEASAFGGFYFMEPVR